MDTQNDRPEGPSPDDGNSLPPADWYPDPASGWSRRWWDGTKWTEHVVGPAARAPKRPWTLARVFNVELGLTMAGLLVGFFSLFSLDSCASRRCGTLVTQAWLLLTVGQSVVLAVCWTAFRWSRRVAVQRAAALLLPIGTVTIWVFATVMGSRGMEA